jgi:ribosomal protein S18 acetylase RimI-like enzyme
MRRLSTCSFEQAVQIWNEGFRGYFVDVTFSLDVYLSRLRQESLSPEHSLIMFQGGKPAGFLLNGMRNYAGQKVAWNGGTGVSPEFRGQGIGKLLVAAALELYAAERVTLATLEAITENRSAISLYEKFGYEMVDRLVFLENRSACPALASSCEAAFYQTQDITPAAVARLEFYDTSVAWQNQWQSLMLGNGAGLVVSDAEGNAAGYALYKRKFDEAGRLVAIDLHQCVAAPGRDDAEQIVAHSLAAVFAPLELACQRRACNQGAKNMMVRQRLLTAGFVSLIEQVQMVRSL